MIVRAPSKINLTLDVFDKNQRTDGYHNLDSLVMMLDEPADELHIELEPSPHQTSIHLTCSHPTIPVDRRNLVYRAVELYLKHIGKTYQVKIGLKKTVPTEAGLGGGSSDAAAVLRGLSDYFQSSIQPSELIRLASLLGADVPLFLAEQPARMRGFGDIIEPLDFLFPSIWGVIVHPRVNVSTPRAYALLDALPNRKAGRSTESLIRFLRQANGDISNAIESFGSLLSNDFESVILSEYPQIKEAHTMLTELGALRSLLCGSGSAVFGLARDKDHAIKLAAQLKSSFPFVTCFTNASKDSWEIKRI